MQENYNPENLDQLFVKAMKALRKAKKLGPRATEISEEEFEAKILEMLKADEQKEA